MVRIISEPAGNAPNVSNMTHVRTAQPNVGELHCARHPTYVIPAQYVRDRRVLHQRGDVG
jgi:hypothetical protein